MDIHIIHGFKSSQVKTQVKNQNMLRLMGIYPF